MRRAGGRRYLLATGVASPPHRQLLGGAGREGRLPHVPATEGQEDGRPPSSPLCLLQQDRPFCGEPRRRSLPLLTHWEAGLQGVWRQQQGREKPLTQGREEGSPACRLEHSEPAQGKEDLWITGVLSLTLLFLPRSKRFLASLCRKTWPQMTSCSWTPGTRWVEDRRRRLFGMREVLDCSS